MSLLGPLDEHLNHQTPRPFRVPGTTDHRFYDRHWFEAISPDGELMMIAGMGVYKNLGTTDGFVTVQNGRQQTNVRVSRPLGDDLEPRVGPLKVEVLEPFERIRLSLDEGDHPVRAELEWASTFPAYLEAPHLTFVDGRVVQDTSRYDQLGRWSGWIELDGERFDYTDWWGVRDHSWGVRPDVGGFEPSHGRQWNGSLLWLWAYAVAGDTACHFQLRESGTGELQHFDGEITFAPSSGRDPVRIERVEHDIRFIEGTRDWETLVYELHLSDGDKMILEATALQSAWAYRGTGYENGFEDSRGVGVPRGELVEFDRLDLSVPGRVTREGEPYRPGHREQPAKVTLNGVPGTGHLPVMTTGRIERYDLGRRR
ncbi:hypothetical protein FPZ12_016880 [Amycolatopsis acidicola]|uniref:Uncharacterized protein n=1 Tax=Amycolatopsis acidicola TaxID=2596893 RepID=A0A5N0V253_9PSEU|nr:hypothetical protein [Amycolatopsis acidicola]KAA9160509.1 hypothetical protein FPZ12_016880 [Amycolatopsis acidicola]